ncbi:MAG TPA: hypothetical protein VIV12_22250 [Streptosporangiaceae bacterium]
MVLALLLPGDRSGGDVGRLPQQTADMNAVEVWLNLAALTSRVPDRQHHRRRCSCEKPLQGNGPRNSGEGIRQALESQHFCGKRLHTRIHVAHPEFDDADHSD